MQVVPKKGSVQEDKKPIGRFFPNKRGRPRKGEETFDKILKGSKVNLLWIFTIQ